MINVGVNSKDAENSLASLEETLKNISKKDADLKVGENLATEVENARKKYLDMVKMVNSTEGELQKAFAISGLKQTIADVNALNKKIAETGAKIKPIELQSVMFDGKELFDIKGIDKSLDKFAKKLDKDSNDAFANILTTNLGQKFFSKQKNELEKQLETDLKDLAKDFSQDKLEQYINKYLKIRSIDVAKNGKDKIATSGVTPKAITDLIDNKAISKQLAEGKIDVKAMFQKKATDVGFVKNMKDQIFSELMVFLNQNTDANTFGTKYTDAQMTEMTQGAKESKKQIKLLKEEFIGLINQYNGFNRNSKIELVLDTVARIESLRKELKGLGQDISEINNIEKQDEYKENLNTLKYTLIPDGNDDYYDEDFDTYLLKLKNDFNKLNNTNIQSIMSMNIGDEKKIEKLKENLTQIDELLIKTNSYDSIVPNVSSEVIGDIEILKKQREQIISGLKQLNVDVTGVGIPMADYIAGGNKGSGGNGSGTVSGNGNGKGAESGTGNGGVMTPEEMEKLKKDYADLTAEVEKYKVQIAETTAKLEEMKKTQAESEGDKSKIKELQASLDALNVSYAEAARKKAEAEKEAAKAAEETANEMSVAEKSREEQKRKALERQAAQSGNQTSNINSAPPDNTTLSAILTEVKSINGKMGGTQSVDVNVGNSPNLKVDGAVSEIKAQSDAMEQAAEKEVAAIQRVANEGKKQFREADMYYYESAKKNANNIYKATIGLNLENGGDRTDEMYRIVNETNKDFFANLRTMYDSAYESVKKIDDVVHKIGKDSSVSKIDIDDIPNESVATLEKVKQLCEEGKSNTVEYISEVQKLFKLFDKYGTDFGNVKQSGAKNKAEYETWIRRSISEASNGKFDNDWFEDNLINEQFYSTSGTHRTLSEIISELFGDIKYHSNKRDVKEYKKILDYYENNKERIHSQKSDYLSGNYIIESFDEEISRIREETNALNTNTEAKKENAQAGQVITNVDNGMTPVSNESTSSAISSEVQAASEAATAEVAAFNTIDDAVKKLTGDINTKTEAIRAEAAEMKNAAKSEVESISLIKKAVSDLATQIQNVPKVRIVGENDGKLNISANLTEEQIAVIREKLKAAFGGEQAIPISFVPNVEGLKQQIADALKNVPVEITNNNINKVIKVNKFKANSDGVEALRNSISSQLKNVKIQSFDATTAAESVKETLSKVLDGVGLKFDTEKLGNEVREAVSSGVEAASAEQKPETSDNKAVRFKEKATNDIGKLRDKYADKLQGQQLEVFKERLNEIDNKIKEIKDDASNYTDENAQVIDKDIKQIESLVNSFKEINNSEDKINSLIQKLKDSKNNIEHRGAVAQPVVNNINSEMSALEELKRSGQNLNVGKPAEVQAFIDKLHEADATVESLQQSAKDIRISTNATASVAKLDSKFNDLLFKVDKFRRDNSKITSDKGISAQFDSLMRSIQTIEKSDVNFQRLRAQFDQLKATVQGKGLTGRSLGDELKYIAEKIGIKAMLGNSIYRVIGAFRQMVGIVTELDTGMTTLRRVTEETEATYRKFLKTAGDEAHELGSTVSGLVDSTGDFARLGYNIQEANALAKNAVMYSNVGWLDIQTATADMTSTMKAFNIEASDSIRIVDTFDILGKKLPLVTISVKGWRHSRPSKDIVNHNICVTTAGGVW